MLHTEVIECLKELDDETLAKIMRMIFDWYDEKPVEPQSQLEKFAWKMILPKLELNKETYQNIVERNKENGKKGGRPKITNNPNNPVGNSGNPNNLNLNYNLNNNISKDILLSGGIEQDETLGGVSLVGEEVVSKGLETLEQTFPERKRAIGIDEINLWNSISQPQKSNLIKMAKVYIRNEEKKENGKFIKQLSKWMKEQIEFGIPEEIKKPVKREKRLFEMTNAAVWQKINELGFSSNQTDLIYQLLNTSLESKEEFVKIIKSSTKEELQSLLN